MGRPPSNGGPSFRFNQSEIAEMEAILQAHKTAMPVREVLVSLAEKFSNSEERSGKIEVQMKQVWNWFQNRRYAIRAKANRTPGKLNITQMNRDDSTMVKSAPQVTQPQTSVRSLPQPPQSGPSAVVRTYQQAPQHPAVFSGRLADNSQMEYEAKSARDGAWYDVSTFLSHRSLETGDPEVMVRFAGFGAEEDEWVNVRKNVRQRSLPCESSECVAVLPADLILCFQEGKEQALYFDAHVLDAQRRRHDVRGCRCRFLVRYDHDQSEEIVALRKICRRPETDYRLQQLHAMNESFSANQYKNGSGNNIHTVSTLRVYPPAEVQPKKQKVEPSEVAQKRQRLDSAPLPEKHHKVEEQNQQSAPPAEISSVEPHKVSSPSVEVISIPSAQDSTVKVPPEVQTVMDVPVAEVSVSELHSSEVTPITVVEETQKEPEKEETALELHHGSSTEVMPKVGEPEKEDTVVPHPTEVVSKVVEPEKEETVVSASELHQVTEVVPKVVVEPEKKEMVVTDVSAEVQPVSSTEVVVVEAEKEEPVELHQLQPAPSSTEETVVSAQVPSVVLQEVQPDPITEEKTETKTEEVQESVISDLKPLEGNQVIDDDDVESGKGSEVGND